MAPKRRKKTAYELSSSQVATPLDVVDTFWSIVETYRAECGKILDLGAGDGRFALRGNYKRYDGIEIDKSRQPSNDLPKNAKIEYRCAFNHSGNNYDVCIGNPPYVRHHDLNAEWRDRIARKISDEADVILNRKCNLYVYFLFLSLLKARKEGLTATVVPFEWVSRPSAKPLREYIRRNGWRVDVYKFSTSIFDGVMTTASISIIDKMEQDGRWRFFRVSRGGEVEAARFPTGSRHRVLSYEARGQLWAMRGMSPGTQKVFTLTEGERIHAGLTKDDVVPCVTTLRHTRRGLKRLTATAFRTQFIEAGAKCWLIKSYSASMSTRLKAYLDSIPAESRATTTCLSRDAWYAYTLVESPQILMATGFTEFGPKVVVNCCGAHAVGSVCGIFSETRFPLTAVREHLAGVNFEAQVVPHAKHLKKIEIRQLNAVLNAYCNMGEAQ
tara:strand:+ start:159 stop:1481 length:1323 start_codon:yes stop_codon:yes gene_type:complete